LSDKKRFYEVIKSKIMRSKLTRFSL